jgi:hypothetical protein
VALAAQAQFRCRRARRLDQPAATDHRHAELGHLGRRERRRLERVDQPQRLVDVVDVDQSQHVGASQAELARRADHVRERLRRVKIERGRVRLGRLDRGPVPEPDPERASRKRRLDLATQWCRARQGQSGRG